MISTVGTPVVGASVSIFVTGTQTKATIYSDDGVTTKTNPITTDSLGRFDFYVADGKYDLQITGPGLTTITRNKVEIADVTEAGINDLNFQVIRFENIRYADQFPGADIGAQINAAYADLSSSGDIYVPSGIYPWSTPIVFATSNKFVRLIGVPKATRLNYTPTTGTAITYNPGAGGLPTGHGIQGIIFAGPGSGTSTTGMIFGGSNGAAGARFQDVQWDQWGVGTQIGSNTQNVVFDHCQFTSSGQGFFYPTGLTQAGEQIDFRDCNFAGSNGTFALNYFQISQSVTGLPLIHLTDCHIDSAQLVIGSGSTHISGLHMENGSNVVMGSNSFILLNGGTQTILGCEIASQQTNLPQYLIDVQGTTLTLVSPDFVNTQGTLTTAVHVSSTGILNTVGLRSISGITNYYVVDIGGRVGKFDSGGLTLVGGNSNNGSSIIANSGQTINGVTGTLFGMLQQGVAHLFEWDTSGSFSAANQVAANTLKLTAAAPTVAVSQVGFGSTTATTATAGAQTLPANPAGFLIINVAGTTQKIPFYNN